MTADQELDRVVAWLRREAANVANDAVIQVGKMRQGTVEGAAMGFALTAAADALSHHEHRETNDG